MQRLILNMAFGIKSTQTQQGATMKFHNKFSVPAASLLVAALTMYASIVAADPVARPSPASSLGYNTTGEISAVTVALKTEQQKMAAQIDALQKQIVTLERLLETKATIQALTSLKNSYDKHQHNYKADKMIWANEFKDKVSLVPQIVGFEQVPQTTSGPK